MKQVFTLIALLGALPGFAQYFNNFDSWPIQAEGNWSLNGPGGTYHGQGIYVNFGNEASGLRKVGFNSSGDWLELPAVTFPERVSFAARLSSAGASTLQIQYHDGSGWQTAGTATVNGETYQSYGADLLVEAEDVPLRIRMSSYDKSVFLDDLRVSVFVPLPVELAAFTVRYEASRGAVLRWRTLTETANRGFEVQRSADGRHFDSIGFQGGAGTSHLPRDYEFTDPAPLPGTAYYRLRQVDFDGTEAYSAVRTLTLEEPAAALTVSPTLTASTLTIRVQASAPNGRLRIVDSGGRPVLERALAGKESAFEWDVSAWKPGWYVVQVLMGRERLVRRFAKF